MSTGVKKIIKFSLLLPNFGTRSGTVFTASELQVGNWPKKKPKKYQHIMEMPINIIWILLMIVGFGSIYFHATLSLAGQLVDEIAILWVIMGSWGLFLPSSIFNRVFPEWFNRKHFRWFMALLTVGLTGVCLISPELNHSALHLFSVPSVAYTLAQRKRTSNPEVARLAMTSLFWFGIALTSWIIDRHLCDYLTLFPYLHCFWHVFVCLGGYLSIVTNAYFFAEFEHPETKPYIEFWPFGGTKMDLVGFPYVRLRGKLDKNE